MPDGAQGAVGHQRAAGQRQQEHREGDRQAALDKSLEQHAPPFRVASDLEQVAVLEVGIGELERAPFSQGTGEEPLGGEDRAGFERLESLRPLGSL